jgi:hypothetical protein
MSGIGLSVGGPGLPGITLGMFSRSITRMTREGESVVPFTYYYPTYIYATQSGRYDALFKQDTRVVQYAELLSILVSMPTGDMPSNMAPQVDTVFKLFCSQGEIQFTLLANQREAEFKPPDFVSLPWRWWQGPQTLEFDPLKLAVVSSGTGQTNRPHQRVQLTAMVRLGLRNPA